MVRELLGNIKGEKGDKGERGIQGLKGDKGEKGDPGDPGEDGNITDQGIGTKNLIDISTLTPRKGTYSFDLENGQINYENIEWYLSQYIKLKGVKHSFRVQDFLTNPNYGIGKMIIHILDSENNPVINNVSVEKGVPVSIDLTGREDQTYSVQLRVTNSELFNGFIDKPMLVEGDIPVLWNMSEKDRIMYNNMNAISNYSLATINNQEISGTISTPNKVTLSVPTGDTTQTVSDNNITLTPGIWLVTINTYITPINFSGYVNLYLYLNESKILQSQVPSTQLKNRTLSHIFKVDNISQFSLRTAKQSVSDVVSFSGIDQNKMTLTRLGGV